MVYPSGVGENRPRGDLDRRTVAEAADARGVSQDAVRKRIARGTIPHDRDASGRVYVYLSPSESVHETDQDIRQDDATKTVQDAYIRSLEDQIAFLRRELERKDTILLNLTDRIPQLEAPASPHAERSSESPETAEEAREGAEEEPHSATGGAHAPAQGPQERPWWRRVFGR
jgi:ribosomal protein L12E/L44/L45/RPP1/RPP2